MLQSLVLLALLTAVAASGGSLHGVLNGAAHLTVVLSSVVVGTAQLAAVDIKGSLGSVHVSCVLRFRCVLQSLVLLALLTAVAASGGSLHGVLNGAAHLAADLQNLDTLWLRMQQLDRGSAVLILSHHAYRFLASESHSTARRDLALTLAMQQLNSGSAVLIL